MPTSPARHYQKAQGSVSLAEEALPILYRDEQIVVIDKPPNLLVHRSEIDRHETRFAIQLLRDQIAHFFEHYKDLEKGKWVKVVGWQGIEEAKKEVMDGVARYQAAK